MQALIFNFQKPINASIQVGDLAFFTPESSVGATGQVWSVGNLNTTLLLGEITNLHIPQGEIYPHGITVVYDNNIIITPPSIGDFLMFAKNRKANTSSLKGYYTEVDFVNDSSDKAELFSIGLQAEESSK
jgi:hypothetical protein|tara:strand:+ start:475 stop:864 length:390 start_codon:yes stop_codon:yes gene_type:complete